MPKDRSNHALLMRRSRELSPYSLGSCQCSDKGMLQINSSQAGESMSMNDWEDAVCPICMNPPHNAVLLLCSSHEKGCRAYMCDTSYRHSNCLDQFKNVHAALAMTSLVPSSHNAVETFPSNLESLNHFRPEGTNLGREHSVSDMILENGLEGDSQQTAEQDFNRSCKKEEAPELACPLCRGQVKGWTIVEKARRYLNAKSRSCAEENCPFEGTYGQLRKHARHDHPLARPREIDLDRQQNWLRLEQQSNMNDVLSTIRSAMPGSMVFGDYVIEGSNIDNEGDDIEFSGDGGNWWSFFLLFHVLGPNANVTTGRAIPSRGRRHTRDHRRLRLSSTSRENWGEGFEAVASAEDSIHGSDAGEGAVGLVEERSTGSASRRRRSRRRSVIERENA